MLIFLVSSKMTQLFDVHKIFVVEDTILTSTRIAGDTKMRTKYVSKGDECSSEVSDYARD